MSLMTAKHFIFDGKSSEEYGVVIGFFEEPNYNESNGMTRTVQREEFNMISSKLQTYGAIESDTIKFSFGIIKCDGDLFSQEESLSINEWLLYSSVPQYFKFLVNTDFPYDEFDLHYYAICTGIEDIVYNGLNGKKLTFETNSPYAYMDKTIKKFKVVNERIFTLRNYSYKNYSPIFRLRSNGTIKIENRTTSQECSYDLSLINEEVVIDNDSMKIKANNKLLSMQKIGWDDESIQWFYLEPGDNKIKITGTGYVELECEYPRKAGLL